MSYDFELDTTAMGLVLPRLDTSHLPEELKHSIEVVPLDMRMKSYERMLDQITFLLTQNEKPVPDIDMGNALESLFEEGFLDYLDPESGLYRLGPKQKVIQGALEKLGQENQNVLPYDQKFYEISKGVWEKAPSFNAILPVSDRVEKPADYDPQKPYPDVFTIKNATNGGI